jgi:excisionase family DNA binding protein
MEPDEPTFCTCHICATLRGFLAEQPARPAPDRLLLSYAEVGALLGVTESTMRGLVTSGEVHAVHISRYWRIPRANIERYVEDLITAPSPWVEKVRAVDGWELRFMGDRRTYTRANGVKFTRTVSWHLGDGRMTLCGRSDGDWEVTDRRWAYSRTCDKCETIKVRLSGLKPETLGLPAGTGKKRRRDRYAPVNGMAPLVER